MLSEVDMSNTDLAVEPAIAANSIAAEIDALTAKNKLIDEGDKEADPAPAKKVEKVDDVSAIEKMQKRIDKLTWEKNEALRRENERLRAEVSAQSKPAPSETVAPTLEQHGFDEAKYQKALLDYFEKRADAMVDKKLAERDSKTKAKERAMSFEERAAEFAKTKPDYAEKVFSDDLIITDDMADAIRESGRPDIAYYLGDNPEKAAAIAKLSPMGQAREIGRIEAILEADEVKPAPKPLVSKAPPPPPKIDASEPAIEKDPSEMSDKEFAKWRRKFS